MKRSKYRTFLILSLALVGAVVGCATEVTSPDASILETQEDAGLQIAPNVESVTVMDESIYTYGETVVKVDAKHPPGVDTNRRIVYEYRYTDSEGNLLPGQGHYNQSPPSHEGNIFFTFIAPNRQIGATVINRHEGEGQLRSGIRIRIYFDDVYVFEDTDPDLGLFFQSNIQFTEITDRTTIDDDKLRFSHFFAKMYIAVGGEFYYPGPDEPVFIRRTFTNLSWDPTNDAQSVQNLNTRKENTLKMYFYVGHPKGSLRGRTEPPLPGQSAVPIANEEIFSEWEIQESDGTWTTLITNDTSTTNWQTQGRIVYYNGTNWVTNSGEGEALLQDKLPPGRIFNFKHEVYARVFHYIAGTNTGAVNLRVTFSYGTDGSNAIDPIPVTLDVLGAGTYTDRLRGVYPEPAE